MRIGTSSKNSIAVLADHTDNSGYHTYWRSVRCHLKNSFGRSIMSLTGKKNITKKLLTAYILKYYLQRH